MVSEVVDLLETGNILQQSKLITCLVRIQITFKTIQTPAIKEFEQGKLEHKEDHLTANELHNRLS